MCSKDQLSTVITGKQVLLPLSMPSPEVKEQRLPVRFIVIVISVARIKNNYQLLKYSVIPTYVLCLNEC